MASLGMADSLILMVMALVVFGPRRLPQIGRQIGKLMYEFRKASNDFKFQMEEEMASLVPAEPAEPPVSAAADATAAEPAESSAEEGYPRILPPSTGEQVSAARPNSLTALAKAARDENAKSESAPVIETTGSQGPDAPKELEQSEQAAQHA